MKTERYGKSPLTILMADIKRNQDLTSKEVGGSGLLDTHNALNALEALTTYGLTENDLEGQEVPQQPAPTENKGEQPYNNYIPENK